MAFTTEDTEEHRVIGLLAHHAILICTPDQLALRNVRFTRFAPNEG